MNRRFFGKKLVGGAAAITGLAALPDSADADAKPRIKVRIRCIAKHKYAATDQLGVYYEVIQENGDLVEHFDVIDKKPDDPVELDLHCDAGISIYVHEIDPCDLDDSYALSYTVVHPDGHTCSRIEVADDNGSAELDLS